MECVSEIEAAIRCDQANQNALIELGDAIGGNVMWFAPAAVCERGTFPPAPAMRREIDVGLSVLVVEFLSS